MRTMNEELLVKARSLADEQRVITNVANRLKRRLERARQKLKSGQIKSEFVSKAQSRVNDNHSALINLRHHANHVIRPIARTTHLARMFLKGTAYKSAEEFAWTQPDWAKIESDAARFSNRDVASLHNEFLSWKGSASEQIKDAIPFRQEDHKNNNIRRRENRKPSRTREEAIASGHVLSASQKLRVSAE